MSYYLDTRGLAVISVGICGRCSLKFPSVDLEPDPNSPGLMVCREDRDDLDPWRLPPREVEDITLLFVRPDDQLATTSVAPGSPGWAASSFPGGQGAAQLPPDGGVAVVVSFITDSSGNFVTDSSGNYITGTS